MHKRLFQPMNKFSQNLFQLSKKNIYHNPKVGYYAPQEEDYLTEVKNWLINSNPQLLCIYFTNEWNPICKKGEEGYNNFVGKNSKAIHLKINVDKFPKLKWFFDSKHEPGMKLYYHGATMKSIGGCNFEKFNKHIDRTHTYITHDYNPTGDYNKEYEMPYYKWEADLSVNGNPEEHESSASYVYIGFRGQWFLRSVPDETHLTHERMRK